MEHYALHLPQPTIPAPPGLIVIVVRIDEAQDGSWSISHDVRPVVGFQPTVVHHYITDEARPVHPDPILMEKFGWRYRHPEMRYAPICISPEGRLASLDPDDPRWRMATADSGPEQIESLSRELRDREALRQAIERRIEDRDQGNVEND